jgi:hypothetical protein
MLEGLAPPAPLPSVPSASALASALGAKVTRECWVPTIASAPVTSSRGTCVYRPTKAAPTATAFERQSASAYSNGSPVLLALLPAAAHGAAATRRATFAARRSCSIPTSSATSPASKGSLAPSATTRPFATTAASHSLAAADPSVSLSSFAKALEAAAADARPLLFAA